MINNEEQKNILHGHDLQSFNQLADDLVRAYEKTKLGDIMEEPAKLIPGVTANEEPEKSINVLNKETIKSVDESKNETTNNPMENIASTKKKVYVRDLITEELLNFDNAVKAAKHFNIHPTTVRTRCADNITIHNQYWTYITPENHE